MNIDRLRNTNEWKWRMLLWDDSYDMNIEHNEYNERVKLGNNGHHWIHHSSSALRRSANCFLKLEFSTMRFLWPIVIANAFEMIESPHANVENCWTDGWNLIFMMPVLFVSFTNVLKLFLNLSPTSSVLPDSIESTIEHVTSQFPLGCMYANSQCTFCKLIGNIVNLFASKKIFFQIFAWLLANVFWCSIFDAKYVSWINGHFPVYSFIHSNTAFKILSLSQPLPFNFR